MKIDTVTVSIHFHEYLIQCLPNKDLLDRWVIVTHPDDDKTIRICEDNGLEYIANKSINNNGSIFAKGQAINSALNHIGPTDWILQLDSDILLPRNLREVLDQHVTDRTKLYWSRRYLENGEELKFLFPDGIENLGLGFFQLWHSDRKKVYPDYSETAALDDTTLVQYFQQMGHGLYELPLQCLDVSGVFGKFHKGRKKDPRNPFDV